MLISEFARAAELSTDTVRFYVKRGLLQPELGRRGGTNPYQVFTQADVATARLVRIAQSLGFTLGEIAALTEELRRSGSDRARHIALLEERLAELDEKAARIDGMRAYLRAKVAWLKDGETGPEPPLDFLADAPAGPCSVTADAIAARPPIRNRRTGTG